MSKSSTIIEDKATLKCPICGHNVVDRWYPAHLADIHQRKVTRHGEIFWIDSSTAIYNGRLYKEKP